MGYGWDDDSGKSNAGMGSGGHDYSSARKAYSPNSGSGSKKSGSSGLNYGSGNRSQASMNAGKSPVGQVIKSTAENLILFRMDVTGSNKTNAETAFKKLPLLYKEALRYLPNVEISFGAIGDAYSDKYPLQVRNFNSGPALDDELNALFPEGNGGGQGMETYELAAYYDLHACETPNAVNPFYFILCDEGFYPEVLALHVKTHIGLDIAEPVKSEEVFKQLMQKFNVYILRCKYDSASSETAIHRQWVDVFGADRVIMLEAAERVIDVMLGLIAIDTGHEDDYSKRLSARQTAAQVKSVTNSLRSKSASAQVNSSGKSVSKKTTSGKTLKSKKLV